MGMHTNCYQMLLSGHVPNTAKTAQVKCQPGTFDSCNATQCEKGANPRLERFSNLYAV